MIRLLDSEWERIRRHFPEENIADGRAGRKPVATRLVLEAALWILKTGAQWHMLPQCYPNYKTVGRGSTIVTSQLPVEHWHEIIGDPTIADAVLDRLVHNAHRLTLKGESLRSQKLDGDAAN